MRSIWKTAPVAAVTLAIACNLSSTSEPSSATPPIAPTPGPRPTFATTRSLATSPPPISGGTLAIARDGRTAVAADPDRDRIYVVDIPSRTVTQSIKLTEGSEPGRATFDAKGLAHVALRGSGNLASIDLATGVMTERAVCAAPRGIAYDADVDTLHVACAEGFLVSIPLSGGDVRKVAVAQDIRDVIVTKSALLVSRFRQADVVALSRDGSSVLHTAQTRGGNVAWRMVAPPPPNGATDAGAINDDEPALVSQDSTNPAFVPGSNGAGYYGAGATDACSAPTITATRLDLPHRGTILVPPAVLPVDLATNGREYAIVAAGNGHTPTLPQIFVYAGGTVPSSRSFGSNPDCQAMAKGFVPGQAVAAAFDGQDQLIVQSREPASLYVMTLDRQQVSVEISLSDESREDTGHAIFHSNSGGFIACASCHAEGGDDGRTWSFIEGERRTPSMRGTVAHTAPFHWDGQMKDIRTLVDNVFTTRMSGAVVADAELATLSTWLDKVPAPPKLAVDANAVERGRTLFNERCTACHSGPAFTNNETVDVGTGGSFQVPPLVGVAWRAPYLHNGCAKTLKDRFGPCGGDKHGDTSDLHDADIAALTSYLRTL